ncbi:MAG TPA: hypothetical protein VI452_14345 [Marmoricola sp.]
MRPEESVFALFDDLEQQAAGLHLAERDAEVGELAVGEYAEVTLTARLHGARGQVVRLRLWGGDSLSGRLERVGLGWVQLDDEQATSWLVRTAAVTGVAGLGHRAVNEAALPVTARLSLRSALRTLAGGHRECVVRLLDGGQVTGVLGRVGNDFVELTDPGRRPRGTDAQLVPLRVLVAVKELR